MSGKLKVGQWHYEYQHSDVLEILNKTATMIRSSDAMKECLKQQRKENRKYFKVYTASSCTL